MAYQLFDFYAERSADFLHGGGFSGTKHLIEEMKLNGDENVLEVGCGTGATLVTLRSIYPGLKLTGVDQSVGMHAKAKRRLRFCGAAGIPLYLVKKGEPYPFADHYFDIIYVESVFAILDDELLSQTLSEISRVLKPGGCLFMNETIWLSETSWVEIKRINDLCRRELGIIQSNGNYRNIGAWVDLIASFGFKAIRTEQVKTVSSRLNFGWKHFLSRLFTSFGQLQALLNWDHRSQAAKIRYLEQNIFRGNKPVMEAYIFRAEKD